MINRWIGVGRITRDIELRKTPNGASTNRVIREVLEPLKRSCQ